MFITYYLILKFGEVFKISNVNVCTDFYNNIITYKGGEIPINY